jgi:hypothetical protein
LETKKQHGGEVADFYVLGVAPHVTHSSYRQGCIGGFINLKDPHAHSIQVISPGFSVSCQRLVASLFIDRLWWFRRPGKGNPYGGKVSFTI